MGESCNHHNHKGSIIKRRMSQSGDEVDESLLKRKLCDNVEKEEEEEKVSLQRCHSDSVPLSSEQLQILPHQPAGPLGKGPNGDEGMVIRAN